jgi:uncharacterized protein Yka (UPF0111/DUF47 family)
MASHKYNYYNALEQMTGFSCQTARYLDRTINNFDTAKLLENIKEMHEIEHAADGKHHEIINVLSKEFLPPIEREDIMELATTIDDITDCIDDVMQHFYLYNISSLHPLCVSFSALILQCCDSVHSIAKEFGNFRKSSTIRQSIIHTQDLESQGDRLYSEMIRDIFTSDLPDKEVFIFTRLASSFEYCCDYCDQTAELFEKAIMKNS